MHILPFHRAPFGHCSFFFWCLFFVVQPKEVNITRMAPAALHWIHENCTMVAMSGVFSRVSSHPANEMNMDIFRHSISHATGRNFVLTVLVKSKLRFGTPRVPSSSYPPHPAPPSDRLRHSPSSSCRPRHLRCTSRPQHTTQPAFPPVPHKLLLHCSMSHPLQPRRRSSHHTAKNAAPTLPRSPAQPPAWLQPTQSRSTNRCHPAARAQRHQLVRRRRTSHLRRPCRVIHRHYAAPGTFSR